MSKRINIGKEKNDFSALSFNYHFTEIFKNENSYLAHHNWSGNVMVNNKWVDFLPDDYLQKLSLVNLKNIATVGLLATAFSKPFKKKTCNMWNIVDCNALGDDS